MLLELESSSLALAWVLDYLRALRRGRLRPFSFCERKTRAATRGSVAWGPTGEQLRELAAASYEAANLAPIFAVLSSRLRAPPPAWRKTYKALVVLEWLATRGSPAAATRACGMRFLLEELRSYRYVEPESGSDKGVNIRHRVESILALLGDSEQLASLRDKQSKTYWAVSSASVPARPTYDDLRPPRDSSADAPPRPRAAGDSKGLTPEAAAAARAVLERAARAGANRCCADCGDSPAGWASASCGVFICQQCAGVHRGLGVHVSVVRSLTLDAWTPAQAAFMAATGNAVANAHWEAALPPGFARPSPQQVDGRRPPELEAFIRRKYTGAFVRAGTTWPPRASGAAAERERPPPPLPPHAPPPPLLPRKPLPPLPEAAPAPPPSVAPMISFFDDAVVGGQPPPLPPPQLLPVPSFHATEAELLLLLPASEAPPASFFGPPRAAPPSLAAASVALPGSVAALLSPQPPPPPPPRMPAPMPGSVGVPPPLPPRSAALPGSDPFAALASVVPAPVEAAPAMPIRPLLGAASHEPATRDVFADLGVL